MYLDLVCEWCTWYILLGRGHTILTSRELTYHEMCATTEMWEACWHVRSRDVIRVTEVLICAIEFNCYNRISHPKRTRNITWAHVTWAHVILRVQLGCERRFTIEFYGAGSLFCHSAQVTWSHVPARFSHFCCRTHFVRRDRLECSSDVISQLFAEKHTVYVGGYTETDMTGMSSPSTVWRQKKVSLFRADSLARYLLQCA